ncbi:CPBP family intramembrane metalloprotease [Pyxidicoccus parkwayensis]|uniref:CPBP family intramembrane metalloprotease n=1 Tax=Pyxidicoccus parkwayensis TaxID=2813578 RepID=A0ABX7P1P2_9BACT|nr:CPBP family intramembrane glutamic endopeptidase [Pyxidicoccus parkwaysis]QSQ24022.1 CPBP family intramembrane metalloprotease [Pyxidicoccus parkwaysis]
MKSLFINAEKQVRNGWKVLGYLVMTTLCVFGLVISRRALPAGVRPFLPEPFLAFLGAIIPSWICARLERTSLADQGFALHRRVGRDFGLGAVGGALLVGLVAFGVWLLDGFHFVRAPEGAALSIVKSAWTMLAVALFEETFFHGYAFQRAIRGLGPRWALLLFSLFFALAHPFGEDMQGTVKLVALLNIFLAGCMLGFCYLRTGSLALPVGVHFGWNWVLGSLGFGVSGNASKGLWMPVFHGKPIWLTGGDYGLEASAVSVGVIGLVVVGLALWKGSRAQPDASVRVPPDASTPAVA